MSNLETIETVEGISGFPINLFRPSLEDIQEDGFEKNSYDVSELKILGIGGSGSVYQAKVRTNKNQTKDVALKLFYSKNKKGNFKSNLESYLVEKNALDLITKSPKQIGPKMNGYGSILTQEIENLPFIIMTYLGRSNIQSLLRLDNINFDSKAFDLESVMYAAINLSSRISNLHSLGLIHKDIKPANLACTVKGIPILDFGSVDALSSCNNDYLKNNKSRTFTPGYVAPEVFDGESSTASDVFSLALTIAELVTGEQVNKLSTREKLTKYASESIIVQNKYKTNFYNQLKKLVEKANFPNEVVENFNYITLAATNSKPDMRITLQEYADGLKNILLKIKKPYDPSKLGEKMNYLKVQKGCLRAA